MLTLQRTGEFIVNPALLPAAQCGTAQNTRFSYGVRILAFDFRLSPEGFLVDTAQIPAYFESRYGKNDAAPAGSCEQMAINAYNYFRSLLDRMAGMVAKVSVTISGPNGTNFTMED